MAKNIFQLKGNKLKARFEELGIPTDDENWDESETDCVERWEY